MKDSGEGWIRFSYVQVVGYLNSFEFTQADGTLVKAGQDRDATARYEDDFSFWNGRVWLCGMVLHGDATRIRGIAPHWCYNELYTTTA